MSIFDLTDNEILEFAQSNVNTDQWRVVGIYESLNGGVGLVGASLFRYAAIDTKTGDRIEASGYEASLGLTGLPASGEKGLFLFTGEPKDLAGASWYVKGSVGIAGGGGVNSGGDMTMFVGVQTNFEASLNHSVVRNLSINGDTVYFAGKTYEYYQDIAIGVDEAVKMMRATGTDKITVRFRDENGNVILEQSLNLDERIVGSTMIVTSKMFDENGKPILIRPGEGFGSRLIDGKSASVIYKEDKNGNFVTLENCFPAGTLITLADHTQKPIEDIRHGDIVLSHDKNGNLTPSIVDKLFTNTTDAFIRLSFTDGREDLIATPGHHFLTETGDYMEIGHMARLGGGSVRVVDTDGSIVTAKAERIIYSAETAEMFEQAQAKTVARFDNYAQIEEAA